jgi:K+-sensing histidine kinase KdpD
MLVQQHAESLLAAWVAGDAKYLERQLNLVLKEDQSKAISCLEQEERELLESISSDLRAALIGKSPSSAARTQSTFQLLSHLAGRMRSRVDNACAA